MEEGKKKRKISRKIQGNNENGKQEERKGKVKKQKENGSEKVKREIGM